MREPSTLIDVLLDNLDHPEDGFTFLGADDTARSLSWRELSREALRRGARLRAAGLRPGDRVALIIHEGDELVLTFLGAVAAGLVPVPMYPPFIFGRLEAYLDSTARIAQAAGARVLVSSVRTRTLLWSLLDRAPCLERLESIEYFRDAPTPAADATELAVAATDPADVLFLQFTSGSTAAPKGVRVTHANVMANCHAFMTHALDARPGRDKGVSWLPMYHDMGLIGFVLAPLITRIPVVFLPTMQFVEEPGRWMETISRHRATITFAPNFALALAVKRTPEAQLAQLDLSCLRVVGCGAEPNHPETLRAFAAHFARAGLPEGALLPCYGLAEATLAVSFGAAGARLETEVLDRELYARGVVRPLPAGSAARPAHALELVSCGRVIAGHELAILDDEGRELPDRVIGEVCFRGPSVAAGYHGGAEAEPGSFTARGLRTGDHGYLVRGTLYVTGRKKDVIVIHGRKLDPQVIEWAAAEVPGLRKGNVVAFTRPGAESEELVIAAELQGAPAASLEEQVARRVRAELLVPVAEVVLLEPGALPKTSSGKLQRAKTRQQYLQSTLGREGRRPSRGPGGSIDLAKHVLRSMASRARHSLRRAIRPSRSTTSPPRPTTTGRIHDDTD